MRTLLIISSKHSHSIDVGYIDDKWQSSFSLKSTTNYSQLHI